MIKNPIANKVLNSKIFWVIYLGLVILWLSK